MNISKNEALLILNCQSENEVEETFEMEVFNMKNKFLRILPPIPLIENYCKKLEKIQMAFRFFYPLNHSINFINPVLLSDEGLNEFLNQYQTELSKIKLQIANADSSELFILVLQHLISFQKNLHLRFDEFYHETFEDSKELIKISEPIDIFEIQEELKSNFLSENSQIKDYICKKIKDKEFESSALSKMVLQSNKILNYGR